MPGLEEGDVRGILGQGASFVGDLLEEQQIGLGRDAKETGADLSAPGTLSELGRGNGEVEEEVDAGRSPG